MFRVMNGPDLEPVLIVLTSRVVASNVSSLMFFDRVTSVEFDLTFVDHVSVVFWVCRPIRGVKRCLWGLRQDHAGRD